MNRSIVSKLQYLPLAYKQRFRFGMAFRARAVVCVTVLCNLFAKVEVKKKNYANVSDANDFVKGKKVPEKTL